MFPLLTPITFLPLLGAIVVFAAVHGRKKPDADMMEMREHHLPDPPHEQYENICGLPGIARERAASDGERRQKPQHAGRNERLRRPVFHRRTTQDVERIEDVAQCGHREQR